MFISDDFCFIFVIFLQQVFVNLFFSILLPTTEPKLHCVSVENNKYLLLNLLDVSIFLFIVAYDGILLNLLSMFCAGVCKSLMFIGCLSINCFYSIGDGVFKLSLYLFKKL
jgi:hypothetical protein